MLTLITPCRELPTIPLIVILLLSLTSRFDSDPREYLKHVMKATNMSCLTPEGATSGECDFLSANMYARSLFGMFCFFFLSTKRFFDKKHTFQARMHWPTSAWSERKQALSLATSASVARRRVLLSRWVIGLRWVCSFFCSFSWRKTNDDDLFSTAQKDSKPLTL